MLVVVDLNVHHPLLVGGQDATIYTYVCKISIRTHIYIYTYIHMNNIYIYIYTHINAYFVLPSFHASLRKPGKELGLSFFRARMNSRMRRPKRRRLMEFPHF